MYLSSENYLIGKIDYLGLSPKRVVLYPGQAGKEEGWSLENKPQRFSAEWMWQSEEMIRKNMETMKEQLEGDENTHIVPVDSVSDANLKLKNISPSNIKKCPCVQRLDIEGHGWDHSQVVGSVFQQDWQNKGRLAMRTEEEIDQMVINPEITGTDIKYHVGFELFVGVEFCSKCFIYLRGCYVGRNGGYFLQHVANATGCTAAGFDNVCSSGGGLGYDTLLSRPKRIGKLVSLKPSPGSDPQASLKLYLEN